MIDQQNLTLNQELIAEQIDDILANLGAGEMDSVPYDTAWIARLAPHFPGRGFDEAIKWLREHQHPDGSWGAEKLHYHDRIVCTLSAIIALRLAGRSFGDKRRIYRGESFLWRANGQLHKDANDTVGFSVVTVSLINEAISLGLDVPRDLYGNAETIEKKLNMLGHDPNSWRNTSMVFSLEAVRTYFPEEPTFLDAQGSVGCSPAATAAVILQSQHASKQALQYLERMVQFQHDGGAADVVPVDTFEVAWALQLLRQAEAISPEHPDVKRVLDRLWSAWSPKRGLAMSSYFMVQDLDCAATGFAALRWGGYPVNPDVFAAYEEPTHFRCFEGEIDTSLSAHIRALAALRMIDHHPRLEPWIEKIISTLRRYDVNGYFWFDKWHASPYYLTCTAVPIFRGISDDLATPRVSWIKKTQHPDGGWGYFGRSTPEETAYALQALVFWDHEVERIDPEQLDAGAAYLMKHVNDEHFTPLWIGKCLYSPRLVVRAAILSALHSYAVHKNWIR